MGSIMVQNRCRLLLVVAAVSGLSGCANRLRPVSHAVVSPLTTSASTSAKQGYLNDGSNAYSFYTQSVLMRRQGKLDPAAECLLKAVGRDQSSLFLKVELAKLYLQRSEPQKSLYLIDKILDKFPGYVPALMLRGNIFSALDNHSKAIEAYLKVVSADTGLERGYLLLGSEYEKSNQPMKAVETYQALIRQAPRSFFGQLHLGMVAASLKLYDVAEEAFLACLDINDEYEDAAFELARIYDAKGEHDAVINVYRKILKRNPENLKAGVELGTYYLRTEHMQEAKSVFGDLLVLYENDPELLRQIALIYLDYEKFEEAVKALEALKGPDADTTEVHYFLGVAYEGAGQGDKAIDEYQKIPISNEYYKSAVVHMSFFYHEHDKSDVATKLMKEAIDRTPEEIDYYLVLGTIYVDMSSYAKAIAIFQDGLKRQPDHDRLHFRLGIAYDKSGDKEGCIREMKHVIRIKPAHVEALNYLGYTYVELETKLDEAEDLIRQALKFKPNDGYITDSLGWLFYKQGRYKEAVSTLEKAVKLSAEDSVILEHLGDAYLKVDDSHNALKYYKMSFEKRKEDKDPLQKKIEAVEKQFGDV